MAYSFAYRIPYFYFFHKIILDAFNKNRIFKFYAIARSICARQSGKQKYRNNTYHQYHYKKVYDIKLSLFYGFKARKRSMGSLG